MSTRVRREDMAQRLVDVARSPGRRVRSLGFPYTSAPTPRGVEPAPTVERLGDAYDTDWARHPLARWTRQATMATVGRVVTEVTCRPVLRNADRIESLDAPAIFVANHHSHLDTTLLLTSLPRPWRHELVVAAAADYFFQTPGRAALAAWAYGAVPMERRKVSRRSADRAAGLLEQGWSLLIFPEGGRSPDGWGQEHKGGAAYLGVRCGVPIVPIHLEGTGRVLPKGSNRPEPGTVTINLGAPLHAKQGEDARTLSVRVESAIAVLADETATDWWSARQRAHTQEHPSLKGPALDSWRRDWTSPDHRSRRSETRRWPD
jgi:1-acyl-sn-glycerol-3-phosphate acyltransferase